MPIKLKVFKYIHIYIAETWLFEGKIKGGVFILHFLKVTPS